MGYSLMQLFFDIRGNDNKNIYQKILMPWVKDSGYKNYFNRIEHQLLSERSVSTEDSWELYAFTRVLDVLTLQFQPNNNLENSTWLGTDIQKEEYIYFVNQLGFRTSYHQSYDPFYCEIVEAVEGENDYVILENYHPSIVLGNLLIKRGGVKVSLNPNKYNLDLVNNSTIYWAYWRKNRPCHDLSHGWGSNSQWRTAIRFDFDNGNNRVYNAEGLFDLNTLTEEVLNELSEANLTLSGAVELIQYRHAITLTENESDYYPYDFRFTETI